MNKGHPREGIAMPLAIAIVAAILLVGGIVYFATRTSRQTGEQGNTSSGTTTGAGSVVKPESTAPSSPTTSSGTAGGTSAQYSGTVLGGKSSLLLDFNQGDYQKALASNDLLVLYFYANWCAICREEVPNALVPAFNELTGDDVVGFRVNYNDNQTDDAERALAREHGVPYQHTKVFVKNGKRVLKSPESWAKSRYLEEIAKAR